MDKALNLVLDDDRPLKIINAPGKYFCCNYEITKYLMIDFYM